MANIKTIALSGAETAVYISGQNCDIRNDGTDIIYASAMPGVTAGADGVLSIPAGQAAQCKDTAGAVYLLGTGSVILYGHDGDEMVFKSAASASGGGGTEDIVARNAINTHAENGEIHLTAAELEAAVTEAKEYADSLSMSGGGGVSQEYVDQQDATTLSEAKNFVNAKFITGSEAASLDNCPEGCWYGQYE